MNRAIFYLLVYCSSAQLCAQPSLVQLVSPEGDYIGQGQTQFTVEESGFVIQGSPGHVQVQFAGYFIELDTPDDQPFEVRKYENAIRFPFNQQGQAGVSVFGNGRGCNTVAGSFEVKEVAAQADGTLERFWAVFELSCEGFMPALTGEIRYRSMLAPAAPEGRILRVPADVATIQGAIDQANIFGDTIVVSPGIYRESINLRGKQLVVRSELGPEVTAIQAPDRNAIVVAATSGEREEARVEGFTIRNGRIGVQLQDALLVVAGNVIIDCSAGVEIRQGAPIVSGNRIADQQGNGIALFSDGRARIVDNIIERCEVGIHMNAAGNPTIQNNIIRHHREDGLSLVNHSDADVIQNLIIRNGRDGVRWSVPFGARGPALHLNTIAANGGMALSADGFDVGAKLVGNIFAGTVFCGEFNDQNSPIMRFNNFAGGFAGICADRIGVDGNISAAPMFLNPELDDYRLLAGSPSLERGMDEFGMAVDLSGSPRIADGDQDGTASVDQGAYEYIPGPPRAFAPPILTSSADGVFIQWAAFDGATQYQVGRSQEPTGPFELLATVEATEHTDLTGVRGELYFYAIAGVNALGVGQYSPAVQGRSGNLPPTAQDDRVEVLEDSFVEFDPRANDVDPNGDPLRIASITAPEIGELTPTASGGFQYSPPPNYHGALQIAYTVADGHGGVASATISIVVLPVNDPPRALPITLLVSDEAAGEGMLQGQDIDGDALQYFITVPGRLGVATVDQRTGQVTYRPAHTAQGVDRVRYRVSDGQAFSQEASIEFLIAAFPDLDRDGMDDRWEFRWDLNRPDADPDGDGASNLEEFRALTNPKDATSVLKIDSVERLPDGGVRLRWTGSGGVRYRVAGVEELVNRRQPAEWARDVAAEIADGPRGEPVPLSAEVRFDRGRNPKKHFFWLRVVR